MLNKVIFVKLKLKFEQTEIMTMGIRRISVRNTIPMDVKQTGRFNLAKQKKGRELAS